MDWIRYQQQVHFSTAFSDPTEASSRLLKSLLVAANHIPQKSNTASKKYSNTWWSKECADARRQKIGGSHIGVTLEKLKVGYSTKKHVPNLDIQ